ASTTLSPTIRRSVAAASGRFPLTSVQLLPPSRDSKAWPPAPGSKFHGRRYPPYVTYTWFVSAGSIARELIQRLGSSSPSVSVPGPTTRCHLPRTFVSMPLANLPPGSHPIGPPHPA